MAVAVGRSAEGIDFSAPDSRPVRLIILVVWNPTLPGLFNHLFSGLASFLIKPDNRDRLFSARDKNELYNVLSQIPLAFPYEDRIVNRASLLKKLQDIELKIRRATEARQEELQKQRALIRDELDQSLLARFDLLMDRYGYAVSEVIDGVCQSCNMSVSTQMASAIDESNDIYICENCGKYLVSPGKKEKEKALTKEKGEREKAEVEKKGPAQAPAARASQAKKAPAVKVKVKPGKTRKN